MAFMYVTEQGAMIKKKGKMLQVVKEGEIIIEKIFKDIDSLVVFGGVHPTSDLLFALLKKGSDISFMSQSGNFRGKMVSSKSKNSILRKLQYGKFSSEKQQLATAKRFVYAKLRNSYAVLDRYHKNGSSLFEFWEREQLEKVIESVKNFEGNKDSLRGHEGFGAKIYFTCFKRILISDLNFDGREYHPAPDPVNALLSFGYSFLAREIEGLIEAMGIDPYLGFYHEISYGRSSLSVDLMEEFRQPFVDRLILKIFNRKILTEDDFEKRNKGVYLKKDSLKIFIRQYEQWVNAQNRIFEDNGEISWRKIFRKQAEALRHAIQYSQDYHPFSYSDEIKNK